MTTYKEIFGKPVTVLSTDPSNDSAAGQVWYNGTGNVLKTVVASGAWSSAASMVTESRLMAGFGTQTAAVSAGGNSNTANLTTTQEYNGTGWAIGGNLPEARFNAGGLGVETAGMSVGGGDPPGARSVKTFEYNGSAWTAGGDLTEEREGPFSFGTETAGIAAGGESLFPGGVTQVNTADEYNGSSWTAVNAMSTTRYLGAACGTETAGVVFGGEQAGGAGYTTNAELYDGTNWTSGGTVPSAQKAAQAVSGIQTDALLINGFVTPNYTATVSEYNGSTFAAGQSTAVPRGQLGASKQQANTTNALAFGGVNPGYSAGPRISATEEYNVSTSVITGGAWASGGNMGTARYTAGDCGVYNAGLVFGGNPSSAPYTSNLCEEYGGTSWTAGGTVPHATSDLSGAGTQTAAVCFAFSDSPTATTATYDGSSWTTVPGTLPTAQSGARGIGTQTAALCCGRTPATFEWDGSSWTSGGAMNNPRTAQKPGGWGVQTAAVIASGYSSPPATIISNTETYNGSSWTETGHSVVTARKRTSVTTAGPSSNGMLMGGGDTAGTNDTSNTVQLYNGSTWVTQANLATARINPQGFGTSSDAVVAGGGPPATNATEEFTAETTAVNIKTITTS